MVASLRETQEGYSLWLQKAYSGTFVALVAFLWHTWHICGTCSTFVPQKTFLQ